MAATDKFTEYATTFYGELPASQLNTTREPLMKLVMIFHSDLRKKFHGIDEDKLHRAILQGLHRLNELGAKHPNIHRAENGMYIDAFRVAVQKVASIDAQNRALQESRQREREAAEAMVQTSDQNKTAAVLYDMYGDFKEWCVKNDFENPAVEAYKRLLNVDLSAFDFNGYACYVLAHKIPTENGIYYNEEVVEAINAHPRLYNRKHPSKVHPAALQKGSIGSFLGRLS